LAGHADKNQPLLSSFTLHPSNFKAEAHPTSLCWRAADFAAHFVNNAPAKYGLAYVPSQTCSNAIPYGKNQSGVSYSLLAVFPRLPNFIYANSMTSAFTPPPLFNTVVQSEEHINVFVRFVR
jgi:hypothetical protein